MSSVKFKWSEIDTIHRLDMAFREMDYCLFTNVDGHTFKVAQYISWPGYYFETTDQVNEFVPVLAARIRTYYALKHAAEQMGAENYHRACVAKKRYQPTPEQLQVTSSMNKVMSGELSIEEAIALVTSHDVMAQRFTASR